MPPRIRPIHSLLVALLLAGCVDETPLSLGPSDAALLARTPEPTTLMAPVFGLGASPDGSLLVAEAPRGVTELRKGTLDPVAALGGVTGVVPIGRGSMYAITGAVFGPPDLASKLFHVSRGQVAMIADLGEYEQRVNPDQVWNPSPPESNPFAIESLDNGMLLVADAAGNDILIVDQRGRVDWVAVLTPQPNPLPFGPPTIQPVATSVAVGPDGAYYAGELTGFPSPTGMSRVWRIAPGSRHVLCPSNACTLVAGGFTSIMDLAFGPDGRLYVVEFDKAGWFAVEGAGGEPVGGGRVSACRVTTGACTVIASGLSLPTAVTVDKSGQVWVAENTSLGGTSRVRSLP